MEQTYDFVIVGAGISGVFAAWRINTFLPDKKVLLVEQEKRMGGRLLSFPLGNGVFGEIGGMRTFPDIDKELTKTLQLIGKKTFPVPYNEPQNIAYLKGNRFNVSIGDTVGQRKEVIDQLYHINSSNLQSINGSVASAELRLAPESAGDWETMFSDPKLNNTDYASSLLRQGVPNGTLEAFRDLSGYNFAFDAPIGTSTGIRENSSLSGRMQQHFIEGGYDSIVFELAKRASRTTILLQTKFLDFEKTGDNTYNAFIHTPMGKKKIHTRNIILAIPPNFLYRLGIDYSPYVENWSAFKAFFTVSKSTWDLLSLNGKRMGRNVSDLPARQIWLYSGKAPYYVILLYCDNEDATFWRNLVPKECNQKMENALMYPALTEAFLSFASRIFGVPQNAIEINSVLFKHWAHGAFFWKKGGYRDLSRPLGISENIFVVGSAISFSQGWTNGSLEDAERTLKKFGIPSVLDQ